MAELYENILKLCQQAGITGGKLCQDLGFSRSTLSDLKSGRISSLSSQKLQRIAEYFTVPVDALLSGKASAGLTARDERDISKKLQETLHQLEHGQEGLMFDGEPIDDETRELLYISLKNSLEISKRIAKQKYTPKKYRD
ncbi:MAG TPA: helix-turn-helix transcriptional regulator [Candidatus Gallacutalibacter pullistercoris]|nr:helix-turn-helix transcriptional regulator [Candidatus Gallacutalibacter pullistercoris]